MEIKKNPIYLQFSFCLFSADFIFVHYRTFIKTFVAIMLAYFKNLKGNKYNKIPVALTLFYHLISNGWVTLDR